MKDFYRYLMKGLGAGISFLIIFVLLLLILEFVFSSPLFGDLTHYLYQIDF